MVKVILVVAAILSISNTTCAATKHWYCVVKHEGLGPHCETCWSYLGGEGGRISCAVVAQAQSDMVGVTNDATGLHAKA
jgi:hypothetical protein